ncbi:MAG: cytochrome d ubiquinol oxidase subunit II [Marinifilaceae bacterium]
MFENLSLLELQQYWWMIIALLGSVLVFLLFVQGGQSMMYTLGKEEKHRSLMINSLGKKWEFTFTTLVTFGGAFFASFPLFYSTSFGGAYWAWIVLLFCFIIQAVSYAYRSQENNFLGKKTYDAFLFINGLMAPLLIGVVVGSFFTGSAFSLNDMYSVQWHSDLRGLDLLFSIPNLLLGLSILALSRVMACLYFMNNIDSEGLIKKVRKELIINSAAMLVFLLSWVVNLVLSDGYAINANHVVSIEEFKYLHNLLDMPVNTILLLTGLILVLIGIAKGILKSSSQGVWFSGIGSILLVFSVFLLAGFNNTSFYPSTVDLQSSLSIINASSSHYTLTAMSYISLIVPFVIAYIFFAWRALNKEKISSLSLDKEDHKY